MVRLYEIQSSVAQRTEAIAAAHGDWPCRKGCADCCRSLAAEPQVTYSEWTMIEQALRDLPAVKSRIVAGTAKVCPMLHLETGACLIYDARPIACRTYGFYAERGAVLGCFRIETLAQQSPDTIWGNHPAVQASLDAIGPAKGLSAWLEGAEWGSES